MRPLAKRRRPCQVPNRSPRRDTGVSTIVYWEKLATRGLRYEIHSDSERKPGIRDRRVWNGSGGLLWKPNSVFQNGSRPPRIRPRARARSGNRGIRPIERVVASSGEGSGPRGPFGALRGGYAEP